MGIVLLLTACVSPNCNDSLSIANSKERSKQYVEALRWYLENTDYHIIFCENSGTDLSGVINDKKNRVEFLTYRSDDYDHVNCTRGYREMQILEYAYSHSAVLRNASLIIKGTGRLILKNITRVTLGFSPYPANFISAYWSGKDKWMDTRFLFFSPSFFSYMLAEKENINVNNTFENVLTDATIKALNNNFKFIIPTPYLDVVGCGAGEGNNYTLSIPLKCKMYLQSIYRRLCYRLRLYPAMMHN